MFAKFDDHQPQSGDRAAPFRNHCDRRFAVEFVASWMLDTTGYLTECPMGYVYIRMGRIRILRRGTGCVANGLCSCAELDWG